jgi:FkbM family methyltransferase
MLKNVVGRIAASAGFEIIADWRMTNLSHTHRLQTLFKYFGITSVIDVGANAGQFRDQLRSEVGFTGPVYSFEPDPALAAALRQRAAADPEWTIFPIALGAAAGTMTFNIMRNSVYNSFHVPDAEQSAHHGNGNAVAHTIDVEVRTLDSMADAFPDLARAYFKIDTQGFDLEVLKGGWEVVRRVPALQTEVSLRRLYLEGPTMEQSIAAFARLGFSVADFFLVSTDGQHRAVEFDCIMVRDN